MTLNRSCFDRNRTMTGLGSPCLAFLGRFKRWLTSMSVAWRGGSSFSTSLASCTIVPVVSSAWSGSSWGSGRPEMRRLFRRPYCSSASWSSRSFRTSTLRESICASRSLSWAFSDCTSTRRDVMPSSKSWFTDRMIRANLFATCSSSRASWSRSLKRASSSSGVSWLVEPCLPCWPDLVLVAMVPEEWGHRGVTATVLKIGHQGCLKNKLRQQYFQQIWKLASSWHSPWFLWSSIM